jgi:hypothetical protein
MSFRSIPDSTNKACQKFKLFSLKPDEGFHQIKLFVHPVCDAVACSDHSYFAHILSEISLSYNKMSG